MGAMFFIYLFLSTLLPGTSALFRASDLPHVKLFPTTIDEHLLISFRDNELMAEQVGYAALLEEECSMASLYYEPFISGKTFEFEADRLKSKMIDPDCPEQVQIFEKVKENLFSEHRTTMTSVFTSYANETTKSPDQHGFQFVGTIAIGFVFSMAGAFIEEKIMQFFGPNNNGNALTREMHDVQERLNVTAQILLSYRVESVLRSLRSFIEEQVTNSIESLFVDGKPSKSLLVDEKGSLWDLIRKNMGLKFKDSLLSHYHAHSRSVITTAVKTMNNKNMYVKVCYPTVAKKTVSTVIQVLPTGRFDLDQKHFVYPRLPEYYVATWTANNVANLSVFTRPFSCKKLGNVDLCPRFMAQREKCALSLAERTECYHTSVEVDKSFVLVRNMLSKQVIATTSGRGQLVHEYGLPEAILLPGQVFSVQLPPSTSLQIRDTVVESRISVVDHIQFTSYGEVPNMTHHMKRSGRVRVEHATFSLSSYHFFIFVILLLIVLQLLGFFATYHFFTKKIMVVSRKTDHIGKNVSDYFNNLTYQGLGQ